MGSSNTSPKLKPGSAAAAKTDPEIQAHQEWLGFLQPRGLVVAQAAMQEAAWVLEQVGVQ
jgi:hypothetical protein